MICPHCEAEYIEGIKECSDCETKLITKEEFELHLINYNDWAIVYLTEKMYEADMIKANLDGANIESIIISQKDINFPSPGDLSVIKLLVKKSDVQDANEIIKDINKDK
jgi:hypothetical protein